jgi:DNA-directed RNA polymerase sigma subunit (sigma70/sigma32)
VAVPTNEADPSTQEKVECALQGLGKLESEVIGALFPTDGSCPEPFESVATRLGMTIEEVKGIADNALRGLRGTRSAANRISTVWN